MKLVIAEKPSVAQSIAKVIGATNREDGYLEGNGYVVSWCVGHLVELAEPEAYDEKYGKWRYEDLPILPKQWEYRVSDATKKQFKVLNDLMKRSDVESLIEATDAGREGELIFRLVYHQAGCKKPFERLWISSMEDKAIAEGFANLKSGTKYDSLYNAALCREHADWMVGINATRLFSTLYGQTLNVGRVMTPTLAMLVAREAEINAFVSNPLYSVELLINEVIAVSEKFEDKSEVDLLLSSVTAYNKAIVRKNKTTLCKEKPPLLYDLTSLQRDANKVLGYTAQQTLDYMQSLYEKKLVTYPRTDSRYLSSDMEGAVTYLAKKMNEKFGYHREWPIRVSIVINDNKVSDHHAIIPTMNVSTVNFGDLPTGEARVLSLVVARLLCAVGETAEYEEIELEFEVCGYPFRTKSKSVIHNGWHEMEEWIMGKKNEATKAVTYPRQTLAAFEEGSEYPIQKVEVKEGKTTPKKHFTEDTLLAAMERAGMDEMPREVEKKGIGTPATRAAVIEKLVRIGFVERRGEKKTKYLIPTHKGIALITVMPEEIQSPSMTAEWEDKLLQIEKEDYKAEAFMDEIEKMVSELIATYQVIRDAEVLMNPAKEVIGTCPVCGGKVYEYAKGFFCENRECSFGLWRDNRFFNTLSKWIDKPVAMSLLDKGEVKLKGCRSVKTGKIYSTTVVMSVDKDGRVQYSLVFGK